MNLKFVATGAVVVALTGALAWSTGFWRQPTNNSLEPVAKEPVAERILVIIVPGTYGNEGRWSIVNEGKASFASEMLRAIGDQAEIETPIWESSINHGQRVEAARNLAELIDKRSSSFHRVCLVGHSHGGNIALMVAGLCKSKIDTLVCLSTPHPYLRTSKGDDQELCLPIYCSPTTLQNTRYFVTISAATDAVPDTYSNALLIGLTENEASRLTTDWQKQNGFPRLRGDKFLDRLFESGNIIASGCLASNRDHIVMPSLVDDPLGLRPHHVIHSRRMGYVIGEFIRNPGPDRLAYLKSLVQPADADSGEPVPSAEHDAWLEQNLSSFSQAGWLLDEASVELDPRAVAIADDIDGSNPDPYLQLDDVLGQRLGATSSVDDTLSATWNPEIFVPIRERFVISVRDSDLDFFGDFFGQDRSLGEYTFDPLVPPPASVSCDGAKEIYWAARFKWRLVHY